MKKDLTYKRLVLLTTTLVMLSVAATPALARTSFGNGVGIDAVVVVARALSGDAPLLVGAGTLLVAGAFVAVYRFIR